MDKCLIFEELYANLFCLYRSIGGIFYQLKKNFSELEKFRNYNFVIKINYHNIKYKSPVFTPEYCVKTNKTYHVKLLVPLTISYKRKFVCIYDF